MLSAQKRKARHKNDLPSAQCCEPDIDVDGDHIWSWEKSSTALFSAQLYCYKYRICVNPAKIYTSPQMGQGHLRFEKFETVYPTSPCTFCYFTLSPLWVYKFSLALTYRRSKKNRDLMIMVGVIGRE